MKPITLIGGGLGGLALANGLRLAEVPVELHEAGAYPRHRVCGEFLAGLQQETIRSLGLESCFPDALPHQRSQWFRNGRSVGTYALPSPAPGISRWALDARMADLARRRGAVILERSRVTLCPRPGLLVATGPARRPRGYIGLKGHWSGLDLVDDLELHLGRRCYLGLSAVEGGFINVCGIFKSVPLGRFPSPVARFRRALEEGGLGQVANRLTTARFREGSFCSVSGLAYPFRSDREPGTLGDRSRMIAPFTGNGMTMALESAKLVLPFLIAYERGEAAWPDCLTNCRRALRHRFRRRTLIANLMQPLLLHSPTQGLLAALSRTGGLPFPLFYRLTHT